MALGKEKQRNECDAAEKTEQTANLLSATRSSEKAHPERVHLKSNLSEQAESRQLHTRTSRTIPTPCEQNL
jgi:hypothetical protein